MANIVLMPQLGISEESALLSAWHIAEGDSVQKGERLFTLETGKASFDVAAEVSGTVLALLAEEGDELPIQAPVCAIGTPGESFTLPQTHTAAPAETPAEIPAPEAPPTAPTATEGETLKISPRAKRMAAETGVSPLQATPSGPHGRIIQRDIAQVIAEGNRIPAEAAKQEAPLLPSTPVEPTPATPLAAYTDEPLSRMRKIIAETMHASLTQMAQLTLHASFDASALLAYRKSLKESGKAELASVSLNDMILFAVAKTLPTFPAMNAHFLGDTLRKFSAVNLGFACDTEKGLLVPVIAGAGELSLLALSQTAKTLASACKAGQINPAHLSGGTFTVTNLGALGVEGFTPVINPPETGILGVGAAQTRIREENGAPVCYPAMPLSLTFDHRAVDGAPAARFLQALCENLTQFTLLLAQ